MTDEPMDPRFEAAVRAALTDLEPGEVPPALRDAVVAVPRREPGRRSSGQRLLAGVGAIAASVVVAVALVGLVDRLAGPTPQPVAASPSATDGVPAPAEDLTLALEPLDPAADLQAIAGVLRARLEAAEFTDATVEVTGDRIDVAVPLGADAEEDAAVATALITAPGRAQLIGLGPDPIEADATVPQGTGELLVDTGEIVEVATRVEPTDDLGILLTFDEAATARFGAYTTDHVMDYLALVIDGVAVYVPSINEPITGGEVVIILSDSGPLPNARVRQTIALLLGGVLPAPVRIVESSAPSAAPASPAPDPTDAEPSDPPSAAPTIRPVDPATLRYECPGFPFSASLLDERRTDEQADTPIAAALRATLAMDGPDYDRLPDAGWTLVGSNDQEAEYVAWREDGDLMYAQLNNDGGWRVTGWGPCHPRLVRDDGLVTARWGLAPGQDIGPDTMTFDAIVTERGCASGQPADERIVGPDVFVIEDDVVVVFAVRPLPGAQTCQPNPSTRVTMALPEPLGERHLVDGADLPLRPTNPTPTEGTVAWSLPVGADVGPATIEFRAVIRDVCDDGRAPDITTTPRQVVVTFRHDPDRSPEGCFVPSVVAIPVVLPEPLGDRELVDGSTLPQAGG
jgi:hypothetical protein